MGTDNTGLSGIEQPHESTLHGTTASAGWSRTRSASRSSLIETERAEPGEDLRLTLDAAIQERVEAVLGEVGADLPPGRAPPRW